MEDKREARKQVAALLQRFYHHLTSSRAAGTTELWHKVERQLTQEPPASEPGPESMGPPGVLRAPMQQQPMQQQQAKTKADDAE